MLAGERVHAVLQGVHPQRECLERLGEVPALLESHVLQSSPPGG